MAMAQELPCLLPPKQSSNVVAIVLRTSLVTEQKKVIKQGELNYIGGNTGQPSARTAGSLCYTRQALSDDILGLWDGGSCLLTHP